MNTQTKTISYKKVLMLCTALFVVTLFGYALLMNAVVSTSKKLTQLEESVISVQTKITQTEKEIITLRKSITKESALTQGFVESSEVAYIKTDTSKTAFLNE
jgi:ABC-type siderophore export system fused ATPase/permease subunit